MWPSPFFPDATPISNLSIVRVDHRSQMTECKVGEKSPRWVRRCRQKVRFGGRGCNLLHQGLALLASLAVHHLPSPRQSARC
jgi:hypothetical protein